MGLLCLLLANYVEDIESLTDEDKLIANWREVNIRMQASTDQHAAMTDELNELSKSINPKFAFEEVMVLIRAIKVQSQVLQLYLGDEISSESLSPDDDDHDLDEDNYNEDGNFLGDYGA